MYTYNHEMCMYCMYTMKRQAKINDVQKDMIELVG